MVERLSQAVGVGNRRATWPSVQPRPFSQPWHFLKGSTPPQESDATGVGNGRSQPAGRGGDEEDSFSLVPSTDAGSGYNFPACIIPESGQGPENSVKAPTKERWDVLHEDEAGCQLANEAGELEEEAAPVAVESLGVWSCSLREVLAGEATDQEVARREVPGTNFPDVSIARNAGPAEAEDLPTVGVPLNLKDGVPDAGLLKPKLKSADSAEQASDAEAIQADPPALDCSLSRSCPRLTEPGRRQPGQTYVTVSPRRGW